MSLLQKAPIDVEAGSGFDHAELQLYRSTLGLLNAGQTLRPYAGALIRNALTESDQAVLRDSDPTSTPVVKPWFLLAIDRASAGWLSSFSQPKITLQDMVLDAFSDDETFKGHFDQAIRSDDLPHYGPITAIAVLEGSIKYTLAVSHEDVFDPRNTDHFSEEDKPQLAKHAHDVTANAGDILLFTNIPATYHLGESLGYSRRAIYYSHLGRPPVVE